MNIDMQFLTGYSIPSLNRQTAKTCGSKASRALHSPHLMQCNVYWNESQRWLQHRAHVVETTGAWMVASTQKQEENVRICLEQSNTCYRQKNHLSSQVLQDKNPAFYTTQSYSMTGKQGGSTLDVMQNIYLTTGELAHGNTTKDKFQACHHQP